MKKWIFTLLFAIVLVIIYLTFYNGRTEFDRNKHQPFNITHYKKPNKKVSNIDSKPKLTKDTVVATEQLDVETPNTENANLDNLNDIHWNADYERHLYITASELTATRDAWVDSTVCENNLCYLTVKSAVGAPSIKITLANMLRKIDMADWNNNGSFRIEKVDTTQVPHTFILAYGRYHNTIRQAKSE